MARLALVLLCVFSIGYVSCSSGSPAAPPVTPGGGGGPQPNPDGVLLAGNPGDNAVAATVHLPVSPVDESDIDGTRLTTRLTAVVAKTATVGDVNAALTARDLRIVAMRKNSAFVSLKTPPQPTPDAAQALAAELEATSLFNFVRLSHDVELTPVPDGTKRVLPPSGGNDIEHLRLMSMPAAWNAAALARGNPRVKVLVGDYFAQTQPHPYINAMRTVVGMPSTRLKNGRAVGNHGFAVAGMIGANYDGEPTTGVSPDPTQLLDIIPVSIAGTGGDFSKFIADQFPSVGHFVLNTSLGSRFALSRHQHYVDLALGAIEWRELAAPHSNRYFHATSAGNNGEDEGNLGEALYNSEMTLSRFRDDPRSILIPDSLTTAQQVALDDAWQTAIDASPLAAVSTDNTIVVGSTNLLGGVSTFSNRNPDVWAPGEDGPAPCPIVDDTCDGNTTLFRGTSMASPLIAGLAAYLWALAPDLSVADLKTAIHHGQTLGFGVVDAYATVLAIDHLRGNGRVRSTVLDVAGHALETMPNRVFDEVDIETFLILFESYELARRSGGGEPDYSRYDLNGNGLTGGDDAALFDLNRDLQLGTALQTIDGRIEEFDEIFATDFDVLCYYAYSELYQGNAEARDELLNPQHQAPKDSLFIQLEYDPVVKRSSAFHPDAAGNLTVYARWRSPNGSTRPAPGIRVAAGGGAAWTWGWPAPWDNRITDNGGRLDMRYAIDVDYNTAWLSVTATDAPIGDPTRTGDDEYQYVIVEVPVAADTSGAVIATGRYAEVRASASYKLDDINDEADQITGSDSQREESPFDEYGYFEFGGWGGGATASEGGAISGDSFSGNASASFSDNIAGTASDYELTSYTGNITCNSSGSYSTDGTCPPDRCSGVSSSSGDTDLGFDVFDKSVSMSLTANYSESTGESGSGQFRLSLTFRPQDPSQEGWTIEYSDSTEELTTVNVGENRTLEPGGYSFRTSTSAAGGGGGYFSSSASANSNSSFSLTISGARVANATLPPVKTRWYGPSSKRTVTAQRTATTPAKR